MCGTTPEPLSVGSMFAGIGGIDLGLERTGGFRTAWFAEIDEFASAVLRKHWPDVPNFGDVRLLGAGTPAVDLVAAGFPCQPVSLAGKRLAQEDPRWLWPHVARVVGDLRPRYVLLENVPGLRSKGLGDVLADLSALGYDAEWEGISASSVGALHRRDRVWIVAYPNGDSHRLPLEQEPNGQEVSGRQVQQRNDADGLCHVVAHADGGLLDRGGPLGTRWGPESPDSRCEGRGHLADAHGAGRFQQRRVFTGAAQLAAAERESGWLPEPEVGRVAHGVPGRVAQLRALGNAVVPQVAELVGRLILQDERTNHQRRVA